MIDFKRLDASDCCQAQGSHKGGAVVHCTWPKTTPHNNHECGRYWGVTSENVAEAKKVLGSAAEIIHTWPNENFKPVFAGHIQETFEIDTIAPDATMEEQHTLPQWQDVLEQEHKIFMEALAKRFPKKE